MNMQKTLIAASVAAAMAAGAHTASAATVTLDITGASAQDNALEKIVINLAGGAANVTKFVDSSFGSNNFSAWRFTAPAGVPAASGLVAGDLVTIRKRSADGAGMGVFPIAKQTPIVQLNLSAATNGAGPASNGITNVTKLQDGGTAGTLLVSAPSQLGLVDTNPELFKAENAITSSIPSEAASGVANVNIKPTDVSTNATVNGAAGLLFGVVVNNNLYNALQVHQGLTTSGTAVNTLTTVGALSTSGIVHGYGTADAQDAQNTTPSLTRAQIVSLLVDSGVTDFGSTSLGLPAGSFVNIARRDVGSGTQAASNAYFFQAPNSTSKRIPTTTWDTFVSTGPFAYLGTSTGNVEKALNDWNFIGSGAYVAVAPVDFNGNRPVDVATAPGYAIGVLSTERNPGSTNAFRFVKIDGYAPTAANAVAGKYDFWSEQTWVIPKAGKIGATTGTQKSLINYIVAQTATATNLLNIQITPHKFGQAGYVAPSDNAGNTFGAVVGAAAPAKSVSVIGFTHLSGTSLDDQRQPILNVAPAAGTPILPLQ